ncbi:MAG: HK97 family phage prohead protease [Hyphomicrobiales bacterium]
MINRHKSLQERAFDLETKYAAATFSRISENGVFTGYASLFDQVDLGQDAVAPGAFRKSLRSRGAAGVRMLFQHDPSLVLGAWLELKEDALGLYVQGQLTSGVAKADEVRALVKAGALDGLSIGFKTIKSRRNAKSGVRLLTEVDLWEISVVTFPMLPEARLGAVNFQDANHKANRSDQFGSRATLKPHPTKCSDLAVLKTRLKQATTLILNKQVTE